MFEVVMLGIIQGIAEWLPVSSEGMVVLVSSWLGRGDFSALVAFALWLHVGTLLAALVYFWRDVVRLTGYLFSWRRAPADGRRLIIFLVVSTLISGVIGFFILEGLEGVMAALGAGSGLITALVGVSLLVTGYLQLTSRVAGGRQAGDVSLRDALVLGVVQGFSIVPGLSRSGLTVAVLLLRGFDDVTSLRVSFLMSMPVVLGANLVLNADGWQPSATALAGVGAAFVFGLVTIHALMKVARRVNFAWFVIGFGVLTLVAAFV